MKKFFEKSFSISLVLGSIAVLLCIPAMSYPISIIIALSAGFLGFIMCCLTIVFTQRMGLKPQPGGLMLLSLFLNSVPLFYMMVQIMEHAGGK